MNVEKSFPAYFFMETLKNLNLVQTETEKWFQSDLCNLHKLFPCSDYKKTKWIFVI